MIPGRNEYDVAYYREKAKHMNHSQIEDLIKNVFKPDKSYPFPKTNNRSFLFKWFESYSWLCYSPSLNGAFCLSCVLFGDQFPTKTSKIKKLFSEPFSHWNDATSCFKRHIGLGNNTCRSGLHESTSTLFTAVIGQMSGKIQPIEVLVDAHAKRKISENRKKQLNCVVVVVYLCEAIEMIPNIILSLDVFLREM